MPLDVLKEAYINGQRHLRVCRSVDVSERRGFRVEVDIEHDLALFRVEGAVRCLTNICPHKHQPRIADGHVAECTVTCPLHGWEFDLRTGANRSGQAGLRIYEVVERDGYVWVNVPE